MDDLKQSNAGMGIIPPHIAKAFASGDRSLGMPVDTPDKKIPSWNCGCGTSNFGKQCTFCKAPKPREAMILWCARCGHMPDPTGKPPKFCTQCGDPFTEEDLW